MATPIGYRLTIPGVGSSFAPGDATDDIDAGTDFYVTSDFRQHHPYMTETPELETASLDLLSGAMSDGEVSVTFTDSDETDPGTPGEDIGEEFEDDTDISEPIARGWVFTSAQGSGVGGGGDTTPTIGGLPSPNKGFFWNTILFGDVFGMPPDNDVMAAFHFTGLAPNATYRVEFSYFNISYGLNLSGQGGKAHVLATTSGGSANFDEAGYPTYPPGHVLTTADYFTDAFYVDTGAGTTLDFSLRIGEVNGQSQISAGLDYVRLVYIPGSGPSSGRILTKWLADPEARQQLLNRPAYLEYTSDQGATFSPDYYAGYVQSITLLDALRARIRVGDTRRVERTRKAFRNLDPTAAGNPFTKVTPVLGGPVYGGLHGLLPDCGLPLFEVKTVNPKAFGVPGNITLEYLSGPLPDDYNGTFPMGPLNGMETVNSRAAEFLTGGTSPAPIIDGTLKLGQYPGLRAWLFDPTTGDVAAFPPMMPFARLVFSGRGLNPGRGLIDPARKRTTWQLDIGPPVTLPAVGQQYRVLIAATVISENLPLHWVGHPVDFVTTLYEAAGIPFDSTTAAACKASLGDVVYFGRFTDAEATVQDVCEVVFRAFRFTAALRGGGPEREFVHFGARVETEPASYIEDADLYYDQAGDDAMPFELSTESIVNRCVVRIPYFAAFAGKAGEARPADALPTSAVAEITLDYSTDGGATADADEYGEREMRIDFGGMVGWYNAAPVPLNAEQYATGIARDLFGRYGRGIAYYTLHTAGIPDHYDADAGEACRVTVSYLPNAQPGRTPSSQRGGDRWMRTVRIESPDLMHFAIRLADESNGVPFGSTVSLAVGDNADDPLHARDVEITGADSIAAAGAHLEFEVGFGVTEPTGHGVRATILDPEDLTAEPMTVIFGNLPANVDVWFRARGYLDGGAPGDWSDWAHTGTSVPTPSGDISNLDVPSTSTDGALFTWDNSNSTGNVKIEVRETGTTPYTRTVVLPPTSIMYAISGLTDDTDYDVRVVLVDPLLSGPAAEFGPVLTDTFTTGDMTGAPTLGIPFDQHAFWGYDAVSGALAPGVYGMRCTPAPGTQDIVFEMAPEANVGADLPGTFAIVASVPASSGTPGVYIQLAAANDGLRRFLRAYGTAPGYNDSGVTAQFRCDPWGYVQGPQPFSFNPPLGRLQDVDLTSTPPADTDVLSYDGTSGLWVPIAPPSAPGLDDLTDVTLTSVSAGDVLVRGASEWINAPFNTVLGYSPLDALSDVNAPTPSDGDVLAWNDSAGEWQPTAPSGGGSTPYISSPEAITANANDNFQGASLDTAGTRFSGATAWAWVNQGGATATLNANAKRLELKAPSSASANLRLILQAVPSGTWKYRIRGAYVNASLGASTYVGLALRDSGSGKVETFGLGVSGGNIIWAANWSSATAFNATRTTVNPGSPVDWPAFLEIENDGTNYILRYGKDELNMIQLASFTKTNYLTSAADGIGVFAYNDCSQDTWLYCREFYRVA